MKSKKMTVDLLIFYLIALVWIILFKLQFSTADLPHIRNINLVPFAESVIVNGKLDVSEIIKNGVAFIPYGVFVHILWEQKSFVTQCVPIFATSLLLEVLQFVFAIGASDITDIIMNSLGGMVGILIAVCLQKIVKVKWIRIINVFSFIGAAAMTLLIAILLAANI